MASIKRGEAIKGEWWRPEAPDDTCNGHLTISEAGSARLDIFGLLFNPEDGLWGPRERFVVWGTTIEGKSMTLFHCIVRESHIAGGGSTCEIAASMVIVGRHWRSLAEVAFGRLSCSLDYLVTWMGGSNVRVDFDPVAWHVSLDARKPEAIPLAEIDGIKVTLRPSVTFSPKSGSVSLTDECSIVVHSDHDVGFEAGMEFIAGMAGLVALASGEPVYTSDMHGLVATADGKGEWCEIIQHVRRSVDPRTVRERELLFNLADVRAAGPDLISNYLKRRKLFGPVSGLYLGTLYNRSMYPEHELLSLAHAAEAFHRVFVGGTYVTDAEYQDGVKAALLDAIPEGIAPDFRKSLQNKLKYLHEYSLRKRLQDLCARFGSLLRDAISNSKQFADDAAKARNAVTHRDAVTAGDVPKSKELFVLCERLGLLLELCLLQEIGFGDALLKRVVENSHRIEAIRLNT